jgi:REP element-mobilizing transposase RayT
MIIGHHLIWTAYGWWLPNDPRGSESHEIRIEPIAELGELHHGRKRLQPASAEIRNFYQRAREVLRHPLLTFTDEEIALLGDCFAQTIAKRKYTCYACAIMPDHVHLLIRCHRDKAEAMLEHFQQASREALIVAERRSPTHPVWGGPGWKVFLSTPDDMRRVVRYIRQNPVKIGWPEQEWCFVIPYDGWLTRPRR